MASVTVAFPIASVLGVPLGLVLAEKYEWHAPFFLIAGLSSVVLVLAIKVLPRLKPHHAPAHPWVQMKTILANRVHQRGLLMSASLVFAGGIVVSFLAPAMVANIGLTEAQLPLIYLAGGVCTFAATPLIGRLSDRYDKLHVLGWVSLGAAVVVLIVTNLSNATLITAMIMTALYMVTMSARFTPAMAMLTNAVGERYRGGFMSVNSAVQQTASGLANLAAGSLVVADAQGRLIGYPRVGLVAVVGFAVTYFLAARLRALAPQASKPAHPELLVVPAVD
jgi:predicted MFS family arabinose efflux permease